MSAAISKKIRERRHAMQRAKERYGIVLTGAVRDEIVASIRGNRSTVAWRTSNRSVVHDVAYDGRTVRVVYDKARGEIVTFLPMTEGGGR